MRVNLMLVGVLVTVLIGGAPVAGQTPPAPKLPADFTFERGKDSPGPVTFSHEQHKAKVDKCTACHVKVFKMKKGTSGPITMDKMKAGQQCGTCHNGKTEVGGAVVFPVSDEKTCERCHKK